MSDAQDRSGLDRTDPRPAGSGLRRGTGNARTNVRPRARSLRCREDSGGLPRVGGPAGIPARRRVSQRSRVLQPGECVLPGGGVRPVDRGVPQGQTVPPARSVSRGESTAGALGRPGPLARTASPVVEARVVLERLVVVSREGLRVVRGLSAGGSGGVRGPASPPAARVLDQRGTRRSSPPS